MGRGGGLQIMDEDHMDEDDCVDWSGELEVLDTVSDHGPK